MQMQKSALSFALAVALLGITSSCLAQDAAPMDRPHRRGLGAEMQQRPDAQPQPQPSALPPTPPTTMPAPLTATAPATIITTTKPHHAQVSYNNGLLDIRANDSSLNQILRSISRETGLKISGGVADQRVFGNYGPASTSEILATLLDGTGTNILLTEGGADKAPELVLTPRGGGPTPPNPSAADFDGDTPDPVPASAQAVDRATDQPPPPRGFAGQAQPVPAQAVQTAQPLANTQSSAQQLPTPQAAPQTSGPVQIPQPANNILGSSLNTTPTASQIPTTNSVPLDAIPTPSTTTGGSGIVDSANPPAPDSTTGATPSTPQSIYKQLLEMQQKQQKPAPAAPTPAPQQ
jgi:hypothetical protein